MLPLLPPLAHKSQASPTNIHTPPFGVLFRILCSSLQAPFPCMARHPLHDSLLPQAGLALQLALILFAPTYLGYWIDTSYAFHHKPATFAGMGLGLLVAAVWVWIKLLKKK